MSKSMLIPEDVLDAHLNRIVDQLQAIPGAGEITMTDLYTSEGWASFTVAFVLPQQDPTGAWVVPTVNHDEPF